MAKFIQFKSAFPQAPDVVINTRHIISITPSKQVPECDICMIDGNRVIVAHPLSEIAHAIQYGPGFCICGFEKKLAPPSCSPSPKVRG